MKHSAAYTRYLRSMTWRAKRAQAIQDAGCRCQRCGQSFKLLTVHHVTYARLGREQPGDLLVLCWPCHQLADAERKQTRIVRGRRGRGWVRTGGKRR